MAKVDRATVNLHFMTRHYLGEIKGEGPLTRGVRIDHIDRRIEAAESENVRFTPKPEPGSARRRGSRCESALSDDFLVLGACAEKRTTFRGSTGF